MRHRPALVVVLVAFALPVSVLHAQSPTTARPTVALPPAPGRIAGVVLVAESGQPLAAAAITVRSASDSAIVAGSLTTPNGRFRIEGLPFGRYLVHVSHLGYKSNALQPLTLTAESPARDIGTIRLDVAPVALPGVEAQAARSAVVLEADRTVYNTRDMPAAAGTAIDVLRAVPELEVDINGKIGLRGNQSVAIHLNGRPAPLRGDQLTSFLQQMPGNRIAKVEVMPNPSAKHDPEGMGGIVNIVFKENVDLGLSGSISATGSTRLTRGLSGRVNLQRGRLTLFTGGGFSISDNEVDSYDLRQNLLAQPVSFIEQNTQRVTGTTFYNVDLTAEWKLGKQSTLWTSAWLLSADNDNDMLTAYGILDQSHWELDRYDRNAVGGNYYGSSDVTVGFKQVFQPQRHELTIDLRVSGGDADSDSDLTHQVLKAAGFVIARPAELIYTDIDGDNSSISLQADYFRPLGQKGKFEIGYRAWKRGEGNDNLMEVFASADAMEPRTSTRTAYDHDEIFHSLYTLVSQTRGKVNLQAGLRAELAGTTFGLPTTGQQFENDYNSVFPSANLSYDFGKGRTARVSYAKRIGRPSPYILNPSVPNDDPLNLYYGNPSIRPTYTHSFTMDLSWIGQKGTLRMAPYYRKTIDNWDQIRTVDAAGVSTMTWANVASLQAYGASVTAALRPTGKLNGSLNFGAFREMRDASNISVDYSRGSLRWSAGLNGGYKLSNTLTASSNLRYMPPYSLVQGRSSGMFFSSIGVRQQLWGTKGSFSVFANDPFDLYRFNFETRDRTHTQTSRTSMKQRMATVSLSYNFGKPPQQNSRRQADADAAPGTIIR